MIIIAGTLNIDPAKAAEATAAAADVMAATRSEEGCHAYVIAMDPIEDGVVNIYEKWEDEAALASHFASEHMAAFNSAMGGFGITGLSLKKYEGATEADVF